MADRRDDQASRDRIDGLVAGYRQFNRRTTLIGWIIVAEIFVAAAYGTWQLNIHARATDALCVLRADLERRVKGSEEFLRNNPQGFAGVSPTVIRRSIDDQKRTIRALSALDC